jgi:uncharacterized protein (TIGR00251 family)
MIHDNTRSIVVRVRREPLKRKARILEATEAGCYLNVEASPGAKKSEVLGIDIWRGALKVSLAAPPVSGQANQELIEMMEARFPEAKGRISLAKGAKSHSKKLFIPAGEATIRKRLGLNDD